MPCKFLCTDFERVFEEKSQPERKGQELGKVRICLHSIYIRTVSSIRLLSSLLNQTQLGPSSSMMGYSPIAKKGPIDQMGKNIRG